MGTRLLLLIVLIAAAWLAPPPAAANGMPVRVVLGYMPGVSNWGPTDAAGVAELVFKEGEVRLSVAGLPRLGSETYNIWLLKMAAGAAYNLGRFNVGPDGTARLDYVLPEPIPEENWDLLLISVEDAAPAAPGPRRSIAGRIEPPEGRGPAPAELPRTGGDAAPPAAAPGGPAASAAPGAGLALPLVAFGGAALGAVLGGGAGFILARRRRSR